MIIHENSLNNFSFNEVESTVKIPSIPVIENSRLDAAVVSINDLNSIVEDYGCDYKDAFCAIAEENNLDLKDLSVAVEDWKLIETPELINLVPNIVVKPISENNIVYQFVDACINEYYETNNEEYLDCLDELSQEGIEKMVGGNYDAAKADMRTLEKYILKAEDETKLNGEPTRSTMHDMFDVQDMLFDPIEFKSDRERQKAKKRGISSEFDIIDYVDALKQRANLHTRNIKKYGSPNPSFLSRHKKAIGLGAAGLVGTALVAKKIASLRKQQQKHPGIRSKLQAIINKLKSKLHKQ